MTVSSFNAKFAYESSLGYPDMQQNVKRREMAKRMGIQMTAPIAANGISIREKKTMMNEQSDLVKQNVAAERNDKTEEL